MEHNSTRAPRWASPEATAKHMGGLSLSTLAHGRISGKLPIPFVKIGGRVLYDLADVDAYRPTPARAVPRGGARSSLSAELQPHRP